MKLKIQFGLCRLVELANADVTHLRCHVKNHDGTHETTYTCIWGEIGPLAKKWGKSVGAEHVTFIDIQAAENHEI